MKCFNFKNTVFYTSIFPFDFTTHLFFSRFYHTFVLQLLLTHIYFAVDCRPTCTTHLFCSNFYCTFVLQLLLAHTLDARQLNTGTGTHTPYIIALWRPVTKRICPLVHSLVRPLVRTFVRLTVRPFVRLSVGPPFRETAS